MSKKLACLLATLTALLITCSSIEAETITVGSDADTYMRDDVVRGDLDFMDIRGGGVDFGGYLRFDLSSLNVLTVESATLTLTVSGNASRNDTVVNGRFSLYGLNDVAGNTPQDWDEAVLTESNVGLEWSTNNGDPLVNVTDLDEDVPGITETIDQVGNYWDAGSTTITVTGDALVTFIQSRVNDDGLVTFIINNDDATDRGYGLATKENATEDYRPRLELVAVLKAKTSAMTPSPADGAEDVPRDVILSWTPGESADKHDVYIGTSFNDVNSATATNDPAHVYLGRIDPNLYPDTGVLRLDFGQTYYWRIDEVNAPPDSTVFAGELWSFTTEPVGYPVDGTNITATASSSGQTDFGPENTINGSGLNDNDQHSTEPKNMWLSDNEPHGAWIQYEFDKVYKLHEMWVWNSNQVFEGLFGFGMKDVTIEYSTNGTNWTVLAGVPEFSRAPGTGGYAHNTTVDFGGAVAKYVRLTANSNWGGILPQFGLSEVRFFSIPVSAREPSPDSGDVNVDPDMTLTWRAGREAATHDVYISTDQQAVIDGIVPAVNVADVSYNTSLYLGSTYYWRIDEVNEAEMPATWQGDVWNFSTLEYLVVDDFEDYNDYPPHEIYSTWLDGYENPANGSQVGYLTPPAVETTTVHGGKQSMPLLYSNTGGAAYSEAERKFAVPQDWTRYGIQTLTLYFHGTPGNTGQLYVKVNGAKVTYPGDAADIAKVVWQQWNIDLASLGVNLQSITTLAIGIDGNPPEADAGTLYVDDIVLYRFAPEIVIPSEEIWIEAEAADTITDPMTVRDDPLASGGKCIGTDQGIGNSTDNPPPDGVATYNFTVQGGIYKVSCRIIIPSGDSFWVRIPGAANLTPGENPNNPGTGWVMWSDPPDSAGWYWDDVFSADHNAQTVNWTLPVGSYTLEIARREDGALLDVIVISRID